MSLLSIESNLPQLITWWTQAPQVVTEELARSLTEASLLLEREVKENTPTGWSGLLRESINASRPEVLPEGVIALVSSSNAYVVPVELGSRPHFVPIQPLIDWVERKIGLTGEMARSMAFAVSRKIAKHGTKGQFMFKRAVEANEQQVQAMLEAAVPRILARLATP